MDAGHAALLGLVQGLTEFLPVSSSGHLAIASHWLGWGGPSLEFAVLLHVGTLVSTLIVFRADVTRLLRAFGGALRAPATLRSTSDGREVLAIVIATFLTGTIGLLLRDSVESWLSNLRIIGAALLVTSVLLVLTRVYKGKSTTISLGLAAVVGVAQGLAVTPGLSRSGTTISTAMAGGATADAAFRFSFLLSLPAVTGAALLELLDSGAALHLGAAAWFGAAVAMVSGLVALLTLRRVVLSGRLWAFSLYLIPLGVALMTGSL